MRQVIAQMVVKKRLVTTNVVSAFVFKKTCVSHFIYFTNTLNLWVRGIFVENVKTCG
jgi:hypothetical protein